MILQLNKVIGRGTFGKVFMVRNIKSDKIFAMKVLKKEEIVERKQEKNTEAERFILGKYHLNMLSVIFHLFFIFSLYQLLLLNLCAISFDENIHRENKVPIHRQITLCIPNTRQAVFHIRLCKWG